MGPSPGDAPGREPPDQAAAEASFHQAQELVHRRNREDNEKAITLLRASIEQNPEYAPAYAGLASAYCEAMIRYGQPRTLVDEAIALAERSVALEPDLLAGHDALAFAYFARGSLRESLEAQRRAHTLDPTYPDAIGNIAFLHLDLGELAEAVEWNRRALAVASSSAGARAYVHRNMGRICLAFGEDGEAEAWLRKAVTLQPDFSSARILLSYLYYTRGQTARFQSEVRALLEAKSDDPETLNYAADLALLRGDLAEAQRWFARAVELGPDSRNFYHARRARTGLAFVLWKQGDAGGAGELFDERIGIRMKEYESGLNAWGPPYELAAIHNVLGHRTEALFWLSRAGDRGWREPHLAVINVLLEGLPGDPTYEKILRDLRNQVVRIRTRVGRVGLPP